MTVIPVSNIARHGIVSDEPAAMQPPEAWTDALNMRFIDSKATRFAGEEAVMDPPSVPPAHLNNIQTSGGSYWLYASAIGAGSKIYVYNSGVHTDVSQAGDYDVENASKWNSTIFQGIPVFNHGNGTPQYWADIDPGTDFADLPNWPADLTAKVVGSYKNYLVALNTASPSDTRPHRVLVSDSAEPGTLPTSWDETDPAVDAVDYDLSDVNSGEILWGAPLRDVFVIYKAEATWIMRHIGGQLIMSWDTMLQTSGIIAPRCAIPLSLPIQKVQVHFVMTGQDLGVFNGQAFESVVDKKIRKRLIASIDPTFYHLCHCFDNPAQDEAWFCYPENGMDFCNMAVVWNYRANTVTFRQYRGAHAASGVVESQNDTTYDDLDDSVTYDNVGEVKYQDDSRRKLIIADDVNTKLLQADLGLNFNGTSFSSHLERTGLAIIGQDREGNPLTDYQKRRLVTRFWPKVEGSPVHVYIGGQDKIGGAVTYGPPTLYDPAGEINYIDPDPPVNTRLVAIKIEDINGLDFSCEGYDIDIHELGDH